MEKRLFGNTGLQVSILGLGAGQVGRGDVVSEAEAERLLNGALDLGIRLIDTARAYGLSETRIGRYLSPSRRSEFVLSTKIGYGIPGYQDWTGPCITAGVDAALSLLRTDCIDIVHLHSCPLDVLQRDDVVEALQHAVQAGKARVAAYSGDNEPLQWAVDSGKFRSIQLSVNVCDQLPIDGVLQTAAAGAAGLLGIIAKRPIANGPWRYPDNRPQTDDISAQNYWDRWQIMKLGELLSGIPPSELALRFTAFLPHVHCSIVGTASLEHLRQNAEMVSRGPLPPDVAQAIRERWRERADSGWRGQV